MEDTHGPTTNDQGAIDAALARKKDTKMCRDTEALARKIRLRGPEYYFGRRGRRAGPSGPSVCVSMSGISPERWALAFGRKG